MPEWIKERPLVLFAIAYVIIMTVTVITLNVNANNKIDNAFEQIESEARARAIQVEEARQERLRQIFELEITTCQEGNKVKKALRINLHEEIQDSKEIDPALFPDIPPKEFQELIQQDIRSDRASIKILEKTNCKQRFDIEKFPDTIEPIE
jgi:hypothetical protein